VVGTGAAGERGWSFGTLLGPGITGPGPVSGWVLVFSGLSRAWPKPHEPPGGVLVVGVTGLLFGNCIVDASIL
jgi:hypothetical protein